MQKQEEGLLFVQILVALNYKFLCSIYTMKKYLHVVIFLLQLLRIFFKVYGCASKSIFDVEAEQKKRNLSSFLIFCGRMKNSNYILGWTETLNLPSFKDNWFVVI